MATATRKTIAYIHSHELQVQCDRLPTMLNRASITQDLIDSYKLLQHEKIVTVKSQDATEDELKLFHSSAYINFLKTVNDEPDLELFEDEQLEFGLGYDCPILENLYDFSRVVAGGSLTAAKVLCTRKFEVAINWFGGWHHAQRDSAEGFCYVNDCVIAVQKLTETYKKILYLDLDIHHGNGVQNAFGASSKVLTVSFHKFSPGFYPGTGGVHEIGTGKGKYYTVNVPLLHGVNSDTYLKVFRPIFSCVYSTFKPEVMVIQCGADSLRGDAVGESNLTIETLGECVRIIVGCKVPVLFLGGGGYNFANSARLWAYLTAVILGVEIEGDIPDSSNFFTLYGPTYELHVDAGVAKDFNTGEYVSELVRTVEANVKCIGV